MKLDAPGQVEAPLPGSGAVNCELDAWHALRCSSNGSATQAARAADAYHGAPRLRKGRTPGTAVPFGAGCSRSLAAAWAATRMALISVSKLQSAARLLRESRFAGSDYEELGDEPPGAHVKIAQRSQNAPFLPWLSWGQVQVNGGEIDVFAHPLQAPLE